MLDDVVLPETRTQVAELGLSCPICLGMLQSPLETTCGHLFCSECLRGVGHCPVCRIPLVAGNGDKRLASPASAAFQRLLAGVLVRCPNSRLEVVKKRKASGTANEACDWVGPYGDLLAKHLAACAFEVVPCPQHCENRCLRRRDVAEHLKSSCSAGSCCDICGLHVPLRAKDLHDATAAAQHVELLKRRCDEWQRLATAAGSASAGLCLQWTLRPGAAASVRSGAWIASRRHPLDVQHLSCEVALQVRFFPRGLDGGASQAGFCGLELEFEHCNCVLDVGVKLHALSGTFGKDLRLDLSREELPKVSWPSFSCLAEEDFRGPLRIDVRLSGGAVLLRGGDSESSSDESW